MRQALSYLALSDSHSDERITAWERRYALPCADRRAGKEILGRIEAEVREIPLPLLSTSEQSQRGKSFRPVTRIQMEQGISNHPRAKRILSHFPGAKIQEIRHYKDAFRRGADQSDSAPEAGETGQGRTLILAEKKGTLLYPGAPVCQSFGNRYFYYASQIMNCIYDCEYCFLKGMYPSDALVVFLNLEDYFAELEALLKAHPVYLCLSYDTDLLALESWTSFLREWNVFIKEHPALSVEIRTKCAATGFFEEQSPSENLIFAYTLSPEPVARTYEHSAPTLASRMAAANAAMKKGFPVRLCFDPVLYCADWKKIYGAFLDEVMETLDLSCVKDVSAGVFRISHGYLRQMRKKAPESAVAQYPYRNERGVACYDPGLEEEIHRFFVEKLTKKIGNEKIFWWKSQENCDKVET